MAASKVEVNDAASSPEVRTAKHATVPPEKALQLLVKGNQRYMTGKVQQRCGGKHLRSTLAVDGQNPLAAIVACADSRCPTEILFDVQPGDLFVLRNAGNTCTHAEGSIVGSLEYCTGHLKTSLVLVLGHTKCGAIAGATNTMLANKDCQDQRQGEDSQKPSALEVLLQGLAPVAEQATKELPRGATVDEVAAHAVKVNVINTMDKLLEYSEALRERVRQREVQVHGAIYDLTTGRVDFLGQSPNLGRIADCRDPPPSVPQRFGQHEDLAEDVAEEPKTSALPEEASEPQPREAPQEDAAWGRGVSPGSSDSAASGRPKISTRFQRWYQHLRSA